MLKRKYLLTATLLATLVAGAYYAMPAKPVEPADDLRLMPAHFTDLPGWDNDQHTAALPALQKSCGRITRLKPDAEIGVGGFAGKAETWQDICLKLTAQPPATDAEARVFFETYFTPYATFGAKGRDGLFTGYYEPILRGSFTPNDTYKTPLYARPSDLITVNLGDFRESLKGETVMGRVAGQKLVPYHARAEIEDGVLKGRANEIVWLDDPVDVFFLHIQGSGRVEMTDGTTLRVGYDSQNGQPYTAIGRELIRRGIMTRDTVSMPAIRAWLEQNPDEAAAVMNLNASYIFFRTTAGNDGPFGAEGVSLTPERSIAVDRRKIPYGLPLWLDAEEPEGGPRLQRLMIAQDTGGAITGAVRGDFFWGAGDVAARKAGVMKSTGQNWLLLPKTVTLPESVTYRPPHWSDKFRDLKKRITAAL